MSNLSCFDVANYFLSLADEDIGDSISNLKLQKLVYYAQGFSLALLGKLLFSEEIEAWAHGPAIPALYKKFKVHGADAIKKPEDLDFSKFDDDTKCLLNQVYEQYGQFSAWKLRDMTHGEEPWQRAFKGYDKTISNEDLKKYFLSEIEE